ncbi:MAG: tRNA lysidine(34) synthetase TilS [Methylococcaceae bacterium]
MALDAQIIESALNGFTQAPRIYIGYSGGVDSHVLLHLCASVTHLKSKITAVYIHHGLQEAADAWIEHCQQTALKLNVNFLALRVNALPQSGESPEEAARNARYQALRSLIGINDLLLVAQHREDQLETVLLQLFRGGGLPGLSGMPRSMVFGQGFMLRPLLNETKQAVIDYANAQQLNWVEDPTNLSNDYDRNFLRNAIVPLLKQRWPTVDKTVTRSAKHCADGQMLISALGETLFLSVFNSVDKTLTISRLQTLPIIEQPLVIREWFRRLHLKMPALGFVERILHEVIASKADSDPILQGQGYCIRRYRDKLYCLQQSEPEALQDIIWPADQLSITVPNNDILSRAQSSAGILLEQWETAVVTVRFRRGGEKIILPGRQGHHSLKKLFQEAGIPPWERELTPLIYLNDKLAAIGDLWISAAFFCEKANACISIVRKK